MKQLFTLNKRLFLLIFLTPVFLHGQCAIPPTVTLNGSSGSTCGLAPFILFGNTFGGSATSVTITDNGGGTVSSGVTATSPFSFTYIPVAADAGNIVTFTATTNNPAGGTCTPGVDTFQLTVVANPTLIITNPATICAPGSVNITAPAVTAGSSPGTLTYWTNAIATTALANPSAVSSSGTYYIKLTNAAGCSTIQPVSVGVFNAATAIPNLFWDQGATTATLVKFDFNNINQSGFLISYTIDGGAPVTLNWSAPSNYGVPILPGQCVVLTLTWLGICYNGVVHSQSSNNVRVPFFNTPIPTSVCSGNIPPLPMPSNTNPAIPGAWSPSTITNSGTYTFTPNSGICAEIVTANITVVPSVVPTFNVSLTAPVCSGTTAPVLPSSDINGITGTWAPATVSNTVSGNYTFTPAAGQCASPKTITITITPGQTPTFATIGNTLVICSGGAVPVLSGTSSNGITGTWSPAVVSNTASGTYTFTPSTGQCGSNKVFIVTVTQSVTIDYALTNILCQGNSTISLPTNIIGVTGSWSPAIISTATAGTFVYTFTATPGQCLTSQTHNFTVTVLLTTVPTFDPIAAFCAGTTAPVLPTTSTNGVTGTWNPAVINNMASASYTFNPTAGLCSPPETISVTVTPQPIPVFNPVPAFCAGLVAPILPTTSNNGFTGTWSPALVDNLTSGIYTFTPDAGQCAATTTLSVTVNQPADPGFVDFAICSGTVAPILNNISPNGYSGTWTPATIDNSASGAYVFTPNANQCAASQTINVTVNEATLSAVTTLVSGAFTQNAMITVLAVAAGNYLYQLDDGLVQQNNIFQYVNPGLHSVTVFDANGCAPPITVSDILIVGYPLYFTPNGDGIHDYWNVIGLQNPANIFIFDRYGKLLKQISPEGIGWDGNYNGEPLPSSDYWFKVEFTEQGASREFTSHFSLKR